MQESHTPSKHCPTASRSVLSQMQNSRFARKLKDCISNGSTMRSKTQSTLVTNETDRNACYNKAPRHARSRVQRVQIDSSLKVRNVWVRVVFEPGHVLLEIGSSFELSTSCLTYCCVLGSFCVFWACIQCKSEIHS